MPVLAGADPAPAWEPMTAPMDLGDFGVPGSPDEAEIVDPVTRLRRLIESRQDETIQILHDWIDEPARGEQS